MHSTKTAIELLIGWGPHTSFEHKQQTPNISPGSWEERVWINGDWNWQDLGRERKTPSLTPITRQEAPADGKQGFSWLGVGLPGWGEWMFDKLTYQFLDLMVRIVLPTPNLSSDGLIFHPSVTLNSLYPKGIPEGLDWMDAVHFLYLKKQEQFDPKVI